MHIQSTLSVGRASAVAVLAVFLTTPWIANAQLPGSTETGFMPELGYPEPGWEDIDQGEPETRAVPATADFFWGTVQPGDSSSDLCTFADGSCKTDLSWIASSIGINSAVFDDPVVNYVMRFYIWGACYRSNQHSYNSAAQFCAQWWLDPVTQEKISVPTICYTREWVSGGVTFKTGCAHKAPGAVSAASVGQTNAMAPAGADWSLVDSASDFIPTSIFNAFGLEPWEYRDPWRECDDFTVEGTPGRDTCKSEAIGLNIGKDVPTLQAFAKITQTESAKCGKYYTDNYAQKGASTDRQFCESVTNAAMIGTNLPALGFVGTPDDPRTLEPVITSPPPPPPPVPPPPPGPPPPPPVISATPGTTVADVFNEPNNSPTTGATFTDTNSNDSRAAAHGILVVLLVTGVLGLLL